MISNLETFEPERSPENGTDDLAKRGQIISVETAELAQHKAGFDRDDEWFDDGGLEQSGSPPVHDRDLTDGRGWADLAGDGHQDEIWPLAVVGLRADDDGGAFLGGGLIGEGNGTTMMSPKRGGMGYT